VLALCVASPNQRPELLAFGWAPFFEPIPLVGRRKAGAPEVDPIQRPAAQEAVALSLSGQGEPIRDILFQRQAKPPA